MRAPPTTRKETMTTQDTPTSRAIEKRRAFVAPRQRRRGDDLFSQLTTAREVEAHPCLKPASVIAGDWGKVIMQAVVVYVMMTLMVSALTFAIFRWIPAAGERLMPYGLGSLFFGGLALIAALTWFAIAAMHFKPWGWLMTGLFVLPVIGVLAGASLLLA